MCARVCARVCAREIESVREQAIEGEHTSFVILCAIERRVCVILLKVHQVEVGMKV